MLYIYYRYVVTWLVAAVMLSPSASGADCWYSVYLLYWYKSTNTDSEVCSVVPAGEWSDVAAARGTHFT
jgi:hypothetical protein